MAISSPSAAQSPLLWRSARVGMTVSEVQQVIPDTRLIAKPSPDKNGWLDLLHARAREGSFEQDISFSFSKGRLAGVVVMMGAPFGLKPIDQGDAKAVRASLRAAYGAPLRSVYTTDNFVACMWAGDTKFIDYLEGPAPASMVMVFIHQEQPGERELLKDMRPAAAC